MRILTARARDESELVIFAKSGKAKAFSFLYAKVLVILYLVYQFFAFGTYTPYGVSVLAGISITTKAPFLLSS